jgi:galactoside O-acetyltransferase
MQRYNILLNWTNENRKNKVQMTEKEKSQQGLLYDANNDKQLLAERAQCKIACHRYNHLSPCDREEKTTIIKNLFGSVGNSFIIEPFFFCDYGYNIEIGNNFYANHNCVILDGAKVIFGNNVFIGPHCGFYTAGHPLEANLRNQGLEYAYPITIGNNVWIGGNVVVMPGVSIGDNSVIGAGSLATKNIPSGVVAFGNPCRVIRRV